MIVVAVHIFIQGPHSMHIDEVTETGVGAAKRCAIRNGVTTHNLVRAKTSVMDEMEKISAVRSIVVHFFRCMVCPLLHSGFSISRRVFSMTSRYLMEGNAFRTHLTHL